MFEDAIQLFEKAFNQPRVQRRYLKAGPQTFSLKIPHGSKPLHTYLSEALTLDFYPAEDPQAKCLLYWNTLSLPIAKDQKVGELHLVSSEGAILKNVPLLATEVIHYAWPYRWLQMSWMMILFAGILAIGFLWVIVRFARR